MSQKFKKEKHNEVLKRWYRKIKREGKRKLKEGVGYSPKEKNPFEKQKGLNIKVNNAHISN